MRILNSLRPIHLQAKLRRPFHAVPPRDIIPDALSSALQSLRSPPVYQQFRNLKLIKFLFARKKRRPFLRSRKLQSIRFRKQRPSITAKRPVKPPRSFLLIDPAAISISRLAPKYENVAQLHHGLDKVLLDPGTIYWATDQEGKNQFGIVDAVTNNLPQPADMNMSALTAFRKPSQDQKLATLARRTKATIAGSTSSLTRVLAQLWRMYRGTDKVDTSSCPSYPNNVNMSDSSIMPPTIKLSKRDGVWFIDSDASFDPADQEESLLSGLGHVGEKLLTTSNQDFAKFRKDFVGTLPESKDEFSYSKYRGLLMRSQIDGWDARLPNKTFDIKTRATISIRMDQLNAQAMRHYEIKTLDGMFESFERERYDLFRNAFLKYSLQARIGGMDGIFIAYHNTQKLFGYQYWPLAQMDKIYANGHDDAERLFKLCIATAESILMRLLAKLEHENFVYLTWWYSQRNRRIEVHMSTNRSSTLRQFNFSLAHTSAGVPKLICLPEEDRLKAYETFKLTRARQLKFTSVWAPENLTDEEKEIVVRHNAMQQGKISNLEPGSPPPTGFAATLLQGVTYLLKPPPFVTRLREMSRSNKLEREQKDV